MITQGNWKFENEYIRSEIGEIIADPYCMETAKTTPNEMEDNARLIAAAPELLAACKGFMRFANRDLPKNAIYMIPERFLAELRDETNKIKRAIAKAEQT